MQPGSRIRLENAIYCALGLGKQKAPVSRSLLQDRLTLALSHSKYSRRKSVCQANFSKADPQAPSLRCCPGSIDAAGAGFEPASAPLREGRFTVNLSRRSKRMVQNRGTCAKRRFFSTSGSAQAFQPRHRDGVAHGVSQLPTLASQREAIGRPAFWPREREAQPRSNVGIGTTNPRDRLAAAGPIRSGRCATLGCVMHKRFIDDGRFEVAGRSGSRTGRRE